MEIEKEFYSMINAIEEKDRINNEKIKITMAYSYNRGYKEGGEDKARDTDEKQASASAKNLVNHRNRYHK